MMTTAAAGQIAGIISFIAFGRYAYAVLKKQSRPNRATWWIWTLVGLLLGASYYSSGARHTMWVPVSYVIGPLTIAVLSLKYGEGGWTPFDRFCLIGSVLSLIPWIVFRSPQTALGINLFIDLLGALPTVRKAYSDPRHEDRAAWVIFLAANLLNIAAIEKWNLEVSSYPLYMMFINGIITLLLFRRV